MPNQPLQEYKETLSRIATIELDPSNAKELEAALNNLCKALRALSRDDASWAALTQYLSNAAQQQIARQILQTNLQGFLATEFADLQRHLGPDATNRLLLDIEAVLRATNYDFSQVSSMRQDVDRFAEAICRLAKDAKVPGTDYAGILWSGAKVLGGGGLAIYNTTIVAGNPTAVASVFTGAVFVGDSIKKGWDWLRRHKRD